MTQDDNAQIGGRNELPASQAVEGLLVPERHGLGERRVLMIRFVTILLLGMPQATPTSPILKLACHIFTGLYRGQFACEGLRQLASPDCDSCLDHLGSRSAKQVSHDVSVSRLNCWP
jgi:hypothetical protein